MAVKGFMRFVNVALLAPLVANMVTSKQQLRKFLYIWLAVAYLGAASGIYQFMGGNLDILTAASSSVLLIAVFVVRNSFFKLCTAMLSIVLLTLSVSKAGLVGLGIALILIIFQQHRMRNGIFRIRFQTALFAVLISGIAIVFSIVLTFSNSTLIDKVKLYAQTAVTAFVGSGDPDHVSPSIVHDLYNRLFKMTLEGIELAKAESSFYILNVFFGSSFGIAGTAAEEIRGGDLIITPHNGFAETYFVGGVLMLFLFILLIYFAHRRLRWLSQKDYMFGALMASFIICVAFTVGYPIMSNIFVGSLFWLTIGAAASYSIKKEVTN
jgi:hypothetical protein